MKKSSFLSFIKEKVNSTLLSNSLKWWLLAFSSLWITRIVFTLVNSDQFNTITFIDFLYGTWIDTITSSLILFPYFALILVLSFIIKNKWIVRFSNILIGILILLFILTNLIDTAYYKFQFSRSNYELFETIFSRIDIKGQFGGIFISYWWLFLIFAFFTYFLFKILNRWIDKASNKFSIWNVISYLFFIGILFLIGRGGIRPRPIGTMDLSRYSLYPHLIGNTPFFLIKTAEMKKMQDYHFLPEDEAKEVTGFIKKSTPQNILPDSTNVVVLILESFGNEFSERKEVTPYLNQILEKSWRFEHSFSNGITSIEGIPAIVSSMPTFSQTNYISSMYGNNQLDGIPSVLKKQGYSSAFFHGATNGSMNFDSFSIWAGYDYYLGRNEYGNENNFDGSWGIYDNYFLPWTVQEMNQLQKPFLGTIFNLSSHHPYLIPENLQTKFKFDEPIDNATAYSDYSLQLFFKEARKQDWFKKTLFVFVADHTSSARSNKTMLDAYKIPIAFYHPSIDLTQMKGQSIASQVDIFPTILDLLNIDTKYYSAGNSLVKKNTTWKFIKIRDYYYHIKENQIIQFQLDESNNLTIFTSIDLNGNIIEGSFEKETKEMKAFLQQITADVKSNKTSL